MSRPEIFKAVVNTLLPKLTFDTLVSLETEKPHTLDFYKHGVRFDLLAEGIGTLLNMEMRLRPKGRSHEFRFAKHRIRHTVKAFQSARWQT